VDANRGIDLGRIHPGDVIQLPVIISAPHEPVERESTAKSSAQSVEEIEPIQSRVEPGPGLEIQPEMQIQVGQSVAHLAIRTEPRLTISVMPGESLSYIAQLAQIPVGELIKANKIKRPDRIKVGDRLHLPIPTGRWAFVLKTRKNRGLRKEAFSSYHRRGFEIRSVKIRSGDTLSALTLQLGAVKAALSVLNPGLNLDRVSPGDEIYFAIRPTPQPTETPQLEGI
jgi:LysM repeat protein